jgi:diguanylate cyclase (GGDEF)-like protein
MSLKVRQVSPPLNKITLHFDSSSLDKQFDDSIRAFRNPQMRLAMLLVSFLYGILGVLDPYFSDGEVVSKAQLLHFLVIIPMLWIAIAIGSVNKTNKFFVPFAVITTATAALCHLYLVHLTGLRSPYVPELYFMVLWIFTVAGFRLRLATPLAMGIILAAILNAALLPNQESSVLYAYYFWLLVSLSLAYLGGHLLEYYSKINFYNTQLLLGDIEERKALQEQLQHAAFHDPLTGLPNRMLLDDRLDILISRAQRTKKKMGWIYVDLDHFKQVNDTFGHSVGDTLLTIVAQRLRECVRDTDTVGRLGGDEFTVLLDGIYSEDEVLVIAEKIRVELEAPYDIGRDQDFKTSASIGVALYPDHGNDEAALSKSADEAMYRSKSEGKNRVTLFSE